ncbi:MAG: acetylxylan esterase [Pirellulaceae bacterium]
MRAIDYLETRDDIDGSRIGCTGNSGGGTLTAYLMALDDRIVAAAPVCYLTTFRRLIDTRGAQDAEQNLFGQIAFGMDEPDYVLMRAAEADADFAGRRDVTFDIDGTWDLFRQSKAFYSRLGYPERVDLHDADLPHGFYLQQREAAARWMHRWLLGSDKPIFEIDPQSLPDPASDQELRELSEGDWPQEQLYCTPDGQALLLPDEKSVFQINAEQDMQLRTQRKAAWRRLDDSGRRALVRRTMVGMNASASRSSNAETMPHESVGVVKRDGYTIEKLILNVEPGIRLPALALVPDRPNGDATLYLHGEGMQVDAGTGGAIERLVKAGQIVLAAELRGIGETETGHDKSDYGRGHFGRDVQEIFLAYLIGRSYVGMRANDTIAWTHFLKQYRKAKGVQPDAESSALHLVAVGEAAIPALHAAAIEPEHYSTLRLRNMIRSWSEVVKSPGSLNQAVNVVHGALQHYDLPELIELVGEASVTVDEPVDVFGKAIE